MQAAPIPDATRRLAMLHFDQIAATVKAIDAFKVKVRLLDQVMFNGKRLGDCTGADCMTAGSGYVRLAAHVRPDQIVSKVLDEDRARAIFEG